MKPEKFIYFKANNRLFRQNETDQLFGPRFASPFVPGKGWPTHIIEPSDLEYGPDEVLSAEAAFRFAQSLSSTPVYPFFEEDQKCEHEIIKERINEMISTINHE